jgi:hypothetical protein
VSVVQPIPPAAEPPTSRRENATTRADSKCLKRRIILQRIRIRCGILPITEPVAQVATRFYGRVPLKRIIITAVCGVLLLALVPTAGAAIRITKIYFDSPGSDGGSKSSLNAEYIKLKNTGATGKYLTGWTIRDTAAHVYRFGTFKLRAGYSVTLHTGSGSNTGTHRYRGMAGYVWNNDGDKATLKNSGGTVKDTCSYSGAGDSVNC